MNFPPKPKKVAYVVIRGRIPGIYEQWWEAKKQIDQFEGACFKGYEVYEEAIEVWEQWEYHGRNLIAARTKGEKKAKVRATVTRPPSPSIEAYARRIVQQHSGPDGSGSHSYMVP